MSCQIYCTHGQSPGKTINVNQTVEITEMTRGYKALISPNWYQSESTQAASHFFQWRKFEELFLYFLFNKMYIIKGSVK